MCFCLCSLCVFASACACVCVCLRIVYSYLHVCLLIVQERSVGVCVRAYEHVYVLCERQHQPMGVVVESVSVD